MDAREERVLTHGRRIMTSSWLVFTEGAIKTVNFHLVCQSPVREPWGFARPLRGVSVRLCAIFSSLLCVKFANSTRRFEYSNFSRTTRTRKYF
jgi:hypothetical protein